MRTMSKILKHSLGVILESRFVKYFKCSESYRAFKSLSEHDSIGDLDEDASSALWVEISIKTVFRWIPRVLICSKLFSLIKDRI